MNSAIQMFTESNSLIDVKIKPTTTKNGFYFDVVTVNGSRPNFCQINPFELARWAAFMTLMTSSNM